MSPWRADHEFLPPTKVHVPSLPMARLPRPGLAARLAAALVRTRLTLLVAPAGFGKTSALVQAIAEGRALAQAFWISADTEDTLQRFVTALVVATEPLDLPWRASVRGMMEIAREDAAGPARLADLLAETLAASDLPKAVLILDDAHRLRDETVFRVLDRLIERMPANWAIAISSRETPPVALARLRVQGGVAEFGIADLRFTLDEFAALARADGRDATPARLAPVWSRMAGWPAGCELALQAGLDRAAAASPGLLAFDLLSSEVVDRLPGELARFLTECAILPELDAAVCAAVTGCPDSAGILREITRRGLFVSDLGEGAPVLKLHDLFRDHLLSRLARSHSEAEIRGLYARAAAAQTDPESRIACLLKAGDLPAAERELAAAATALLPEGEIERLMELIGLFPADSVAQSADLSFYLGLCQSCFPRWRETALHMADAARLYRQSGRTDRSNSARAYELVACFGLARTAEAREMLAALEAEPLDTASRALAAFGGYLISRVGGTVDQEMAYFDRMLDALLACNDPVIWNLCGLHIYLGLQRGMRGRAERYATAALAVAGDRLEAIRDSALSMRARHALLAGDSARATAIIAELECNQRWNHKPYSVRGSIQIAKSLTVFLGGDAAQLRAAAEEFRAIIDGREGLSWAYWRGLTALFFGKLHAALDDWEAVAAACARLDDELRLIDLPYLRLGRSYLRVLQGLHDGRPLPDPEALAVLSRRPIQGDYLALEPALVAAGALLLARRADHAAAWAQLSQAVDALMATGETFHLLLLGRSQLRQLAAIPVSGGDFDRHRQCLLDLAGTLEANGRTGTDGDRRNRFGLTARELEVLDSLAAGSSNKVIARALSLSPYTVKRHVANILDKMGATSRGEAAALFRDGPGRRTASPARPDPDEC